MGKSIDTHFRKHRSAADRPRPRRLAWTRLMVVVATLGLTFSVVAGFATKARERTKRVLAFENEAQWLVGAAGVNFNLPIEALRSTATFIATAQAPSRSEFRAFVSSAMEAHPQIYCFEWIPRVPHADRASVEAAARADGFASYSFTEKDAEGGPPRIAGERDVYLPILYMEPPNDTALGLDSFATPEAAIIPNKAIETRLPAASGPYRLIEDPEGTHSVICYAPAARIETGRYTERTPEPGENLGVAAVILRIEPTVERARELSGQTTMDMVILDLTDGSTVYASNDSIEERARSLDPQQDGAPASAHPRRPLIYARNIPFADRDWRVVVAPATPPPGGVGGFPWLVLLIGVVVTGLVTHGVGQLQLNLNLHSQMEAALELGQYTLGRKLGEGGMGMVYEAQHRMLARPAAIKLIRPQNLVASGPGSHDTSVALDRFEQEARATARLQSAHTIEIYDFGRTEGGDFYYVMELLEGLDLESLVARFGPVEPARAVHLLRQACVSLAEAHAAGMVHRDIKPANIYICRHALDVDFVKVLDFGLVKERRDESSSLTQQNTVIGTPTYMAPEMVLGKSDIDGRADLYALGCVAYFLLTGELVFDEPTPMAVATQHVSAVPIPPSRRTEATLPDALEDVILRCLEKDPERRPTDARELERELARCEIDRPWSQARAQEWWKHHHPERRSPDLVDDPPARELRTIRLD